MFDLFKKWGMNKVSGKATKLTMTDTGVVAEEFDNDEDAADFKIGDKVQHVENAEYVGVVKKAKDNGNFVVEWDGGKGTYEYPDKKLIKK